jgi:hypothetical protein
MRFLPAFVYPGALLLVAGAAMMRSATWLFRRLGTNLPPPQPTTLIATTGSAQMIDFFDHTS